MLQYDLEKQHKKGKLHAIERIQLILDENTFVETETKVSNIRNGFGMDAGILPYDGVITGYGMINGKKVYIYSQDFTVMGGTLGKNHGLKIANSIKKAIKSKCPIIAIIDSGGARIQEGIDALAGYGEIFYYNTLASGYIPQIAISAGPCAGGAVYSPAIMDFIFTVDSISTMFVTGPKIIKSVNNEIVSADELGGAYIHAAKSGVSHFRSESENECYKKVRELINIIPHCYEKKLFTKTPKVIIDNKSQSNISDIVPKYKNKAYDMRNLIRVLFDDNSFMEIQEEFAKNIIIGLAKLGTITVGIVANQPNYMAGVLDCDTSDKAARFIRYCDNYNIPIITLTDVPGFMPGIEQESRGIIRHGAKMLYAYSEATTIKLNVIIRKAFGGAYIAMSSKHLRADKVYAWPDSEVAVMGANAACELLYAKKVKMLPEENQQAYLDGKIKEYEEKVMNVKMAVRHGYVDAVIEPVSTREILIADILNLKSRKPRMKVNKKHGNIPL